MAKRRAHQAKQLADNNAIQQAMIDSGASSHFVKSAQGLKQTGISNQVVVAANGAPTAATHIVELPLPTLDNQARQATVVPAIKQDALLSVRQLADSGYTTVFHPHNQGCTVHDVNSLKLTTSTPALLQGWREAGGLWTVPLPTNTSISPSLNVEEVAFSAYELPSTKEVVRFLHAALGFSAKATLLTAIKHGNLVTFPGLTTSNVTKHFPESDETQKGHINKGNKVSDLRRSKTRMQCSSLSQNQVTNTRTFTYVYLTPPRNPCTPTKQVDFPSHLHAATNT